MPIDTLTASSTNEYTTLPRHVMDFLKSIDTDETILVVTDFGGDILPVETSIYKDNNEIRETGNLSDVFKESILTSTGFIKANCNLLNINVDVFNKRCIHLHMPSIAIKKDGPSGGVAITTAIISAIKKYEIPNDIAFTGEMTLKGNILPVGGIKDKIIGALNRNIKTI